MNSFSIVELEQARANPVKFGKNLKDKKVTDNSNHYNYPKSQRWFNALLEYYDNNDKGNAFSLLEQSFSNRADNKKNRREVENLTIALDNCIDDLAKSEYILIEKRHSIHKEITSSLTLTGWIWLIFLKPERGYVGFFISKEIDEINWMLELKYPIIQDYIANSLYGCQTDEVDVGVIDYTSGDYYTINFSQEDINNALEELTDIGSTISSILEV